MLWFQELRDRLAGLIHALMASRSDVHDDFWDGIWQQDLHPDEAALATAMLALPII